MTTCSFCLCEMNGAHKVCFLFVCFLSAPLWMKPLKLFFAENQNIFGIPLRGGKPHGSFHFSISFSWFSSIYIFLVALFLFVACFFYCCCYRTDRIRGSRFKGDDEGSFVKKWHSTVNVLSFTSFLYVCFLYRLWARTVYSSYLLLLIIIINSSSSSLMPFNHL